MFVLPMQTFANHDQFMKLSQNVFFPRNGGCQISAIPQCLLTFLNMQRPISHVVLFPLKTGLFICRL